MPSCGESPKIGRAVARCTYGVPLRHNSAFTLNWQWYILCLNIKRLINGKHVSDRVHR